MTSIKSGKTRDEGEVGDTPDILGQSGPSCSEQCKLAESLDWVTARQPASPENITGLIRVYSNLCLTLMAGDDCGAPRSLPDYLRLTTSQLAAFSPPSSDCYSARLHRPDWGDTWCGLGSWHCDCPHCPHCPHKTTTTSTSSQLSSWGQPGPSLGPGLTRWLTRCDWNKDW